jgi:hypothetical protein
MQGTSNPLRPSFWSIERVVAMVVGPLATAGSGWLALVISTNLPGHPQVSSGAIYAFASTVAGGTATLIYKWLAGRSAHTLAVLRHEADAVQPMLSSVGVTPALEAHVGSAVLAHVEQIAEAVAKKIKQPSALQYQGGEAVTEVTGKVMGSQEKAQGAPTVTPIAPAQNDPAPATPATAEAQPSVPAPPPPSPAGASEASAEPAVS